MNILLTGGAGYIGSHTAVELIKSGYSVVIADDLSNSDASVIDKIEKITGKRPLFYEGDVADHAFLEKVFCDNDIDAVIHFAGFKAVGESVEKPIEYYRNNLDTTLTLLEVMRKHGCKDLIFSSSATVYSQVEEMPLTEKSGPLGCSLDQVHDRADPEGCVRGGSGDVGGASQVFQSYRGA